MDRAKQCCLYSRSREDSSLKFQQEQLRAYAAENGYEVVFEASDLGGSGPEHQCGLQDVLTAAKSGGYGTLLVHSYQRLGRDAAFIRDTLTTLRESGIELFSIKEGKLAIDTFLDVMQAISLESLTQQDAQGPLIAEKNGPALMQQLQ